MNYWHMQMHPFDLSWGKERKFLEEHSYIGLGNDDSPSRKKQVGLFQGWMTKGDIVAIRCGGTLLALTRVTGDYEWVPDGDAEFEWISHRRKVEVLDLYCKYIPTHYKIKPQGLLERCVDTEKPTYKAIDRWYKNWEKITGETRWKKKAKQKETKLPNCLNGKNR